MKICLIQAGTFTEASLGILTTAKNLKKHGHIVTLIGTKKGLEEIWEFKRDLLLEALYRFKPDVVGFSVMTPYADYLQPVSKFIKLHFPDIVIVAGGNHIYARKENVLRENPDIDYIFLGESEKSFPKFLALMEKKDRHFTMLEGIGFRTESGYQINSMAHAGHSHDDMLLYEGLFDVAPEFDVYSKNIFKSGSTYVLLTRGCPFQCTYCANLQDDIVKRSVRQISPDLFEEQLKVLKKMGIRSLLIADAEFNLNKEWAYKIMDIMLRHNVKLRWVNLKIELVTEEFIKRLKDLDIQEVSLPIESGSPRIRNEIFNRGNVSDKQIYQAFEYVKKYDVLCGTNMIVGAPTETLQDIEMTKEMLLKVNADVPLVLNLVPLPGTILFEKYKETIKWNSYAQFDVARDMEEVLVKDFMPKCPFQIDAATFYEQFKLLEAITYPLSVILRRNFQLQGKHVVFFATCNHDTALKILRIFIANKVKHVTIFLPEDDLVNGPFEKYSNVRVEKIPRELAHIRHAIKSPRIMAPRFIASHPELMVVIEKSISRFPILKKLNDFLRMGYFNTLSWRCRTKTRVWAKYLKSTNIKSNYDYLFFEEKMGTYRDMIALAKYTGFKTITSLDYGDCSFNRIDANNILVKIKSFKYFRKISEGKQKVCKKHQQRS